MTKTYYKAVKRLDDGRYISLWDNTTEYPIGGVVETSMEPDPDAVAVRGIHIASLPFAVKYGRDHCGNAILELEVNLNDVVVPNAKDQLRASRVKVLREVPKIEYMRGVA